MKHFLLLLILSLLSCDTKSNQEIIRQRETFSIIQTLIEQKGPEMIKDIHSGKELPICLNLKKIIINTKCFEETKANNKITLIKLPEKSFKNQGEVCIEKIYNSKPLNNSFFLLKDTLDIVHQNKSLFTLKIPKSITHNFKTVELTKKLKTTEKYIQFSIPIFSKDNTKSYLEFEYYSKDESYGKSIYLENSLGKWRKKFIERNWAI